ncbi:MAG: TatD family hydrolase [Candidatus Micrarchaeaceae archaeon]
MATRQLTKEGLELKDKVELADAHSHLDLITNPVTIRDAVDYGVKTIITDGVDTKSNMEGLRISDNINIFAAIGVDPEHCMAMKDDELEFNVSIIKENANRIVAVGEIGLDYKLAITAEAKEKQKQVFGIMLDTALDLGLPVSVHSREAFPDVLKMVTDKGMKKVHFHFFDGNEEQAKEIAELGYFISVPPYKSQKRAKAIAALPLHQIMGETDSPIVGSSPKSVENSVMFISGIKKMDYINTAKITTENTKAFFNIKYKSNQLSGLGRRQ